MVQQDGPVDSAHSQMLEYMSSVDIAQQLSIFHFQLFEATDEVELVTQVIFSNNHLKIFPRINKKKIS